MRVRGNVDTPSMQTAVSDIGKSVLAELECPACKKYMVPPITFCLGGHNICNTCRPTVSCCPNCKQGYLHIRNVALENLSQQMKSPCAFSKYGCKDTLPYNAIRQHEAICDYRSQKCPVDDLKLKMTCIWTGIAKDVKEHLQTEHKDLCEDYNDQHLLLLPSSKGSSYRYKFLFAYNEIFCYRLLIQRGTMCVGLHYFGPTENDLKYQFKVIVMNNEDTEGVVLKHLARTATEDDVFFPRNCLKLHRDLIECFRNEKGELTVLMKVLRLGD